MNKKVVYGFGGAIALVALLITAAWALGFLSITVKKPTDKVAVYQPVCQGEPIDTYLGAFAQTPIVTKPELVSQQKAAIQGIENWQADPSCVYMVFRFAVAQRNVDEANQLGDRLNTLKAVGLNPDLRLGITGANIDILKQEATDEVFDPATSIGGGI